MEIKVTRNFSLANLELVSADDMREIGLLMRERIITRTRRGIAADGSAFEPLSPGYAKHKHQALGGSPRPDLTVSGNLLNQLTITAVQADGTRARVTLGWTT